MLPDNSNKPAHRRRDMTMRQIQRRASNPVPFATGGQISSSSAKPDSGMNFDDSNLIYTFGTDGKAYRVDGKIVLSMSEKTLYEIDIMSLYTALTTACSPIYKFMQESEKYSVPATRQGRVNMLHFGVWMNNVNHYSGGRVHILLAVHLLAAMGHKVTVVTDQMPKFLDDFKYFEVEDRIEFISGEVTLKNSWMLKNHNNNIDIVIATPRICEAFYYAEKWRLPCYALLLESPNFVSEHRGGLDGTEAYWREYKQLILSKADAVISNPGPTLKAVKEWLEADGWDKPVHEFPPAINTPAADRVSVEERNEIVFVGRHLDFKCPDDVIKAVGRIKEEIRPSINFVGSHNYSVRRRLQGVADRLGVGIRFYAGVNDFEKFHIIKRSKLMVIPSRFEGFGMPPAEAIYCMKPVVAYDLEITKWIYGDAVTYVKPGDTKELAVEIVRYLRNDEKRLSHGLQGLLKALSPESNIPLPYKIKNKMRRVFYGEDYPRITAGIIVLNGADVIGITIDSIYDSVEKIIVVEGVVEDYAVQNSSHIRDGHSIDHTLEAIKEHDPLGKVEIVKIEDVYPRRGNKCWKNKNEMQNEIAKRINTELYLKVDSDEVWKESDIEFVRRTFMLKKDLTVMYMQRWHFWKDLDTVAVGGQWECAEARAWRWRDDFRHPVDVKGGFNFYVDKDGDKVADPKYKTMKLMMKMHYHLGYCRDEKHILDKIKYYKNRGIEVGVQDNYSHWKPGQPTNSTHPDGTTATQFMGRLPIILDKKGYPDSVDVGPKEVEEDNVSMLPSPNKDSSNQ